MSQEPPSPQPMLFDEESWRDLSSVFEKLPEDICLNVWGDTTASDGESDALTLCETLATHFDKIHTRSLPRRINYSYYPVIGFMLGTESEQHDFGVRIIGHPTGYQMTSLITAIQAIAFRGATLEAVSRIKLHRLSDAVQLELLTSAEDEGGPMMAKIIFGLAVASPHIKSYLIMTDRFPEANLRYSVNTLPHLVINSRVHVSGVVDEDAVIDQIASAVRSS